MMAPRLGSYYISPASSPMNGHKTDNGTNSAARARVSPATQAAMEFKKQQYFNTIDKDASSKHVNDVLRRQVGLLAGKTAKRRLTELRNTSRLPRAHLDFLSDSDQQFDNDSSDSLLHRPMKLSWDEIFVEDMLGMGGFGSVCLVTCPKLRKQREKELSPHDYDCNASMMNASFSVNDDSSVGGMSMMLSYASTTTATGYNTQTLDPNKYYACKSLSNKTIKQANVRGFVQAAADLVHEAFLLCHINPHPNLIRLYGVPSGNIDTAFDCEGEFASDLGYFLVLEALSGILSDKVHDWKQKQANLLREQLILRKRREQAQQHVQHLKDGTIIPAPPDRSPTLNSFLGSPEAKRKSHTGRSNSRSGPERTMSGSTKPNFQIPRLEERLEIAHQIALGMQHLHSHGIVFRDLKPHNVGMSICKPPIPNNCGNGPTTDLLPQQPQQTPTVTWRLFDFGLAREVPVSAARPGTTNTLLTGDPCVVYGKAGSLRYMAPETMGGRWLRSRGSHNKGCFATFGSDVYSFSILLWELVGLQNFDKKYDANPEDFESAVCDRGHRPGMEALDRAIEMDEGPCRSSSEMAARACRHGNIRELVHACWREDYRQRPNFDFILEKLKEMLPASSNYDQLETGNYEVNASEDDQIVQDDTEFTIDTDLLTESGLEEIGDEFQIPMGPPLRTASNASQAYEFVLPERTKSGSLPKHSRINPPSRTTSSSSSEKQHPLNRMSGHTYRSGSNRSRRRLMMKRPSARTLSSRSMYSASSMSNHSMVLEDVFEAETEHSNGSGSNQNNEDEDDDDVEDTLDAGDVEASTIEDELMGDHESLMNESVLTMEDSNRKSRSTNTNSSQSYLEYDASNDDDEDDSDLEEDEYTELEIPYHSAAAPVLVRPLSDTYLANRTKKSRKNRSNHTIE